MHRRLTIFLAFAILLLSACANINHTSHLQQKTGKDLIAGKGDVILRVNHEKNLPNAFGGSDIFGRKSSTGTTIVQYNGREGSTLFFSKSGVTVDSNETTMSRSGMIVPVQTSSSFSGTVGTKPVTGVANSESSIYVPPSSSTTVASALPSTNIKLNMNKEKFLVVEGYIVHIIDASENSLTYRVETQQ